jgi:hypothetical protein
MSEGSHPPQAPPPNEQAHELSGEQLYHGYTLGPDEVIAVDVTRPPKSQIRSRELSNGAMLSGTAVMELQIGGENDYATGYIINEHDGLNPGDEKSIFLVLYPDRVSRPIDMKLKRGQMWGIGRKFENQSHLPDTVSGDHCEIGLDEQDRLIIANHQPTNMTGVRSFYK